MGTREKKQKSDDSRNRSFSQLNPYFLAAPFGAVVLLHFFGWLYPGSFTWGFSYWSLTSPTVAIGVFIVSAILILPPVTSVLARGVDWLGRVIGRPKGSARALWTGAALVGAAVILYALRSKALVYGDGYSILNDTAKAKAITFYFQSYFQPLSVYFCHYVFHSLDSVVPWSPDKIYAVMNIIGGLVGLMALVRLSGQVTKERSSRWFVMAGMLSSASVLLFFGYIENYTWALAMGLWSLSFTIRYAQKRSGAALMVIFAVLAFLFHMATLPFAIVALIALFMQSGPAGNNILGLRLRTVNILIVVGSVLVVAASWLMEIDIFVPLVPVPTHPYSAVSVAHLTDMVNELALVGALGLALLILTAINQRRKVVAVGPEDGVLGTLTLLTLLVSFWINPDIGAPRDWDLLSFFGFPITIWGLFRFTKLFPNRRVASQWAVAAIVIVAVQLGANIYEKNQPHLAVERLDGLLTKDAHYQPGYREARPCLAFSVVLQEGVERPDLAIKYLERRSRASDDCHQSCFNLGDIYQRMLKYDSAAKYMAKGLSIKPDEMRFLMSLCKIEQQRGQYIEAVNWASQAVTYEPNNIRALTELGISLGYTGRIAESAEFFRRAHRLAPGTYEQNVNLGLCYAMTGTTDSAYYYVARALPIAPHSRKPDLYCCLISAAIELNKPREAARYLHELKQIAPNAPDIPAFTASLAKLTD